MDLYDQVEAAIGRRPRSHRRLTGGMIGQVLLLKMPDGPPIVAKFSRQRAGAPVDALRIEAMMLRYLAQHTPLPIPEVFHADDALLLMAYIDGNSRLGPAEQEHAAELVAALHGVHATEGSGFPVDTHIAELSQPNPWTASWVTFFREQRLLYMAGLAHKHGALSDALYVRVQRLAEHLERWLTEPPRASLLHGDLWTTNILTQGGRVVGFIDPALYFGHPEVELAFSTLFGTFGEPFFRRYQALRPLDADFFERRRDLYNLYPLLVHVRLFGGSYLAAVDRTLRQYGA